MSDLWGSDEDFRDNPVEYDPQTKSWAEVPVVIPPPIPAQQRPRPKVTAPVAPQDEVDYMQFIDAPAEEFQSEEEEDESFEAASLNANQRIDQGMLYKQVMNHDLFEGVDADPVAIKNVQREIRRFAKERMEVMLGMKQERPKVAQVSSPFNSLEVALLKQLTSKMSNGKTEEEDAEDIAPVVKQAQQAKKGLNRISGPVADNKLSKAPVKPIARKQAPKTPMEAALAQFPKEAEKPLNKPIHEMSEEELLERNQRIAERNAANKAAAQSRPAPMSQEMINAHYESRVNQDFKQNSVVNNIMNLMNNQNKR